MNKFHAWAFQNFPFMEETFREIDNYHLMMDILHYLKEQLKDYRELVLKVEELENWFKNLDVQEEVNNKLDEMAESGELEEIIASYLQSNAVISFNTLSDLVNAENLVDGMTARTLGHTTYLDGQGRLYKIRNIDNDDVVDGVNIITITNSNTLIAELIPDDTITKVDRILNRKYIFIGDSYATPTNSWVEKTIANLGLTSSDYYKSAHGSYGFVANEYTSGSTFTTLLTNIASSITDKDSITDIIVCGGVNDYNQSALDIISGIQTFMTTAKTLFQNAHVSVGMISWSKSWTYLQQFGKLLMTYSDVVKYGGSYINGSEYSWHYINYLTDDVHPNEDGQILIGKCISNYITTGAGLNVYGQPLSATITASNGFTKDYANMGTSQLNDKIYISSQGFTFSKSAFSYTFAGTWIEFATFTGTWLSGGMNDIIVNAYVQLSDDTYKQVNGLLRIRDGKLLFSSTVIEGTSVLTANIKKIQIIPFSATIPAVMN